MRIEQELELIRGAKISRFVSEPERIPCIETSDVERLCRHPLVSVWMITYNHESFIRQALDSIVSQKTDFEFEVVIGEDCSNDQTREICFQYQKRYPDRIRVLWWHENVRKMGGNARRVDARCRGEYIAYCEGDDYWTDPLKLQKQVDIMRRNPNVGLCFGCSDTVNVLTNERIVGTSYFPDGGVMAGNDYNRIRLMDDQSLKPLEENHIRTASAMVRVTSLVKARREYANLFTFVLFVGDYLKWAALAMVSDVFFMADKVAAYRIHPGGITSRSIEVVRRDCFVIKAWFLINVYGYDRALVISTAKQHVLNSTLGLPVLKQMKAFIGIVQSPGLRRAMNRRHDLFLLMLMAVGLYRQRVIGGFDRAYGCLKDVLMRKRGGR